MGLDQRLREEIVRRVLRVATPERIIVFGSAATGQMTADSDIDVLVVAPSVENARTESVRIGDALRGLGFPFDVIVMARERFEETKNVVGGIAYPASREGTVLYEAA
jgi:predicted nucleotidyltransferase